MLKRPERCVTALDLQVLTFYLLASICRKDRNRNPQMHTTISQMFYPDRQAFFVKLSLSLSLQPAIKIGPAPLPSGEHRPGSRNMRKAVPTETLSSAQRSMKARIKGKAEELT